MLNEERLQENLPIAGLGERLLYFKKLPSTNEHAARVAMEGAPHGTLVFTEQQTQGRGRAGRSWYSRGKSSLTFSILLRGERVGLNQLDLLSMTASLSLVEALAALEIPARIKWPNDVIVKGKKVAGILVESSWIDQELDFSVVGWGINLGRESIPVKDLDYPAGYLAEFVKMELDPADLIRSILESFGYWMVKGREENLQRSLEEVLAFRGEKVHLWDGSVNLLGIVLGLTNNGQLRLMTADGEVLKMGAGEVRIRPIDTPHE